MRVTRQRGNLRVELNVLDRGILLRAFEAIMRRYRTVPAELDPKVNGVWYSTRGCGTARMSEEETRDWLNNLHACKSANLVLLQKWAAQIGHASEAILILRLPTEEAHVLLTVLNDHRLAEAACHDISEEQMHTRFGQARKRLKPAQQAALFEIDILAYFMEKLLQCVAPEAAGWMES